MRALPPTDRLPYALYRAEQVREFDRLAIQDFGIPAETLMERAGAALFAQARQIAPQARRWLVFCGAGNNGGDGYVAARLAHREGLAVRLILLTDPAKITGAARFHLDQVLAAGADCQVYGGGALPAADLIIDALLGTGLDRPVTGLWAEAIAAINSQKAPVISADIPSGLHADTGTEMGVAVRAALTLSFVGLKTGLFTGVGPDCCGEIRFDGLEIPARVYGAALPSARRLDWDRIKGNLPRRPRHAHKGQAGHLLVIGGAPGFSGAPLLAGVAALRSGAGLVTLATHPEHAALLNLHRPELMCRAIGGAGALSPLLEKASAIVLGPGLGQSPWSLALYQRALAAERPMVIDADALNLLAKEPQRLFQTVITPHSGEAGRLLRRSSAEINADRFQSVTALRQAFAPVVVLKGAGSLIAAEEKSSPALCSAGNPGMATAGMGDVLSGVIGALLAQGMGLGEAAEFGVVLHAAAADRAALKGERGLLAMDVADKLQEMLQQCPR